MPLTKRSCRKKIKDTINGSRVFFIGNKMQDIDYKCGAFIEKKC
jgi:hypothetical protein